jgi:hypothetical protein
MIRGAHWKQRAASDPTSCFSILSCPKPTALKWRLEITSDWMLHSVPIVFVTSLITPEEARDARRINGHRISAKPHTAAEVLRVVEESLPRCAEA